MEGIEERRVGGENTIIIEEEPEDKERPAEEGKGSGKAKAQ